MVLFSAEVLGEAGCGVRLLSPAPAVLGFSQFLYSLYARSFLKFHSQAV